MNNTLKVWDGVVGVVMFIVSGVIFLAGFLLFGSLLGMAGSWNYVGLVIKGLLQFDGEAWYLVTLFFGWLIVVFFMFRASIRKLKALSASYVGSNISKPKPDFLRTEMSPLFRLAILLGFLVLVTTIVGATINR
jgi:hypothetical protein